MTDTAYPVRPPDLGGRLRALIEEAWDRARRRRRLYAGVAFSTGVIAAIVLAASQGPANSQSGSGVLLAAGPNARGPAVVNTATHTTRGIFRLVGSRGSTTVVITFSGANARRSWEIGSQGAGQYAKLRGGGGHVEAGGRAGDARTWYARLVGYVSTNGRRQQHVVIKLNGRRSGTFVITPTQPGALERDAGTQDSTWLG